jgi:RNA polymerase sigma-70 factor (ECF subfamily)
VPIPTSGRPIVVELERIRSGDSQAFGRLLEETWAPLVTYLLTILDLKEAAEDAAQEAFVRLWEHRDRWTSGSARALLFRIGRNVALDQQRRAEVRRRFWHRHRPYPAPSPSTPEEELTGSEFQMQFQKALESLPPRRREVFELIRFRGFSHKEVAQSLELSYQTVANHLRLAMKDLRYLLDDSAVDGSTKSTRVEDQGREGRTNDG